MASDLLLDTSSPVITINQATLIFKINENYLSSQINNSPKNILIPISENEIIVTNITSNYIAYRSRITKKKYYAVEPSHLILCPNSNIKVKITFYFNPKEKFPPEGHKFRFEGIIIPNNLRNKDSREIFEDFSKNKKEVKGNSIKKVVEFIFDNNFNYTPPPSIENIKLESSQSISSVMSNSSVYSNALSKSMERPSRISLRSKKNVGKLSNKKVTETVDPVKLKNEYDKLKEEYDNNIKELNSIKEKINNLNSKNKFRYIVPDIHFSSLSPKMIAILFGTAFFLGFYLTK
jgi:hypothetical protein